MHSRPAWPMTSAERLGSTMKRIGSTQARACCVGLLWLLVGTSSLQPVAALEPADPYRQALLIGVWDYANETKLSPMVTDLDLLKQSFLGVGFDRVIVQEEKSAASILTAIDDLAATALAHRSGRSVLTVIYFGGHGTMVNNTSYLLAEDFKRPAISSELIVSGAVRVNHIAERMKVVGEPLLLIVDTCRNPFTPGNSGVTPDPSSLPAPPPIDLSRMIAEPARTFGFAAFYSQRPGQLVRVSKPQPTEAAPFVRAVAEVLPGGSEVAPFAAAVRQRVIDETLSEPLEPQYLDEGGGKMLLYYRDIDRSVDRWEWESTAATGREDLVRDFIARFLTSRYAVIARQWIESNRQLSQRTETLVRYTSELRRELGANSFSRVAGNLFNLRPKMLNLEATASTSAAGESMRVALDDVRQIRRIPGDNLIFEVTLIDNAVVEFEGPLMKADPSRLPIFWSDAATLPLQCELEDISSGHCNALEAAIAALKSASHERIGTLFVASVAGGESAHFAPATTHAMVRAIALRMQNVGVEQDRFAFRSFSRADLGNAISPILIKRGDGKPISMESVSP